eukprot:13911957-Alexandrium_andersonii.AAC.1
MPRPTPGPLAAARVSRTPGVDPCNAPPEGRNLRAKGPRTGQAKNIIGLHASRPAIISYLSRQQATADFTCQDPGVRPPAKRKQKQGRGPRPPRTCRFQPSA